MGTGTDVAIESAGITLVQGDLRGIVRARRLSRATMRNIRQNLFLAFVYNAVGVPVAAGVLYPFIGAADQPDLGERGDDVQLGVGDCQRAAAPARRDSDSSDWRRRTMAIDPVCKMQIDENKAAGKSEYNGKTYYFCAPVCKTQVRREPAAIREVTDSAMRAPCSRRWRGRRAPVSADSPGSRAEANRAMAHLLEVRERMAYGATIA